MTDSLMIRNDAKFSVQFTPEAVALKSEAIRKSESVVKVSTAAENESAVLAMQEIQRVLKLCESTRVACKSPVLDFGRLIDSTAKDYSNALELELARVKRLANVFAAEELERQRKAEAQRRAAEEKARLERESEEKRIRDEAEAKRRQAEAQASKPAVDAEDAEWNNLASQAQKAELEAEQNRKLKEAREKELAQIAAAPVQVARTASGQSVSEVWVIDSIDSRMLLNARPDLVRKVEFDMVAVKSALKILGSLPGVKAHKEVESRIRSATQPTIDIK